MARTMARPPARTSPAERSSASSPVVPLVVPSRRRPTWMLAGVASAVVCAVLAAWVFTASSKRTGVLVAARDMSPGEVLSGSDVRVVEVGQLGDVRAVMSSQEDLVVGRAARGPIPAGTILNTGLFAARDEAVPAGQVVVGAALDPGATPTARLAAGDRVDLLVVAATTSGADAASAQAQRLGSGSVWSLAQASSAASGKVFVSLLVPAEVQTSVAQAASEGRLRLALTGAGS
jgi:hypothetical protein